MSDNRYDYSDRYDRSNDRYDRSNDRFAQSNDQNEKSSNSQPQSSLPYSNYPPPQPNYSQNFIPRTQYYQPKKEKKSVGCGTIILIFAILFVVCPIVIGSLSSYNDMKEEDENPGIDQVETQAPQETKLDIATKEPAETTLKAETDEQPEQPTSESTEQILWETDMIKVTATGIDTTGLFTTDIKLLVENKSDTDLDLRCDAIAINDYMIDGSIYTEVTAHNKVNDDVSFFSSELDAAGISNIGKIDLYLYTVKEEDFIEHTEDSGCITIKTSDFDKLDTENNITGTTIIDENGVKVIAQYVNEDSFWGQALVLYVENNTDKVIDVRTDDEAVNGFMISGYYTEEVYPGKRAIGDVTFFSSDLEDNKIDKINDIELTVEVSNDEDYSTIAKAEKAKIVIE